MHSLLYASRFRSFDLPACTQKQAHGRCLIFCGGGDYVGVGHDRRNSQGRVEIKGASPNFPMLQLAGETAQHDLNPRHPKFCQ